MRKALWALPALIAIVVVAVAWGIDSTPNVYAGSLVVNTVSDHAPDTCDPAPGDCTLREAMLAVAQDQTITFDIPGDGPHFIHLTSAMVALTKVGVTIDGYTQPGASPNNEPAWHPGNASIQIVLDGDMIASGDSWGLWLSAKDLIVRGLSFVNFNDEAIKFATFPSAAIQGNYIGVLPDGVTAGPNKTGITLRSSETGNLIGGSAPEDRNVISGNTEAGVEVTGSSAVSIAGNFIGTEATGMTALPNGGNGLDMKGGTGSTIGGSAHGAGNLISGNLGNGIGISTPDGRSMNVKGNLIGVAADNATPLPNHLNGVLLDQDAFDITIGGEFNPNERNTIAFNLKAGVSLTSSASSQNYIDPNFTYSNGGLGADLMDDGLVQPNDYGDDQCDVVSAPQHCPDADTGPNNLMNYPVVTGAELDGTTLTVDGYLESFPNQYYNMFFFANRECDASGYGEGEIFLGSLGINTGPTGRFDFERSFPHAPLDGRTVITMSASDPESSSEFSECQELTAIGTPTPSPSPTPTPTPTPSPTVPAHLKKGDYNCDDAINDADVFAGLDFLATGERPTVPEGCPSLGQPDDSVAGDVDCDGQFTPRDTLAVLIADAGAEPLPLPSGCAPVGST